MLMLLSYDYGMSVVAVVVVDDDVLLSYIFSE